MYPNYPQPTTNITTSDVGLKDPMRVQLEHYNLLHGLGLAVLAKDRKSKRANGNWKEADARPQVQLSLQEQFNSSGWVVLTGERSNRLFVIDIDPADMPNTNAEDVYKTLQELCPTSFVLKTPANGVHLYYRVPKDKEMLRNRRLQDGVDTRGEGGLVVSLGGYNRYVDEYAEKKGVESGHEASYTMLPDGDYTTIPEMNDALYEHVLGSIEETKTTNNKNFGSDVMVVNYGNTEIGSSRVKRHFQHTIEEREAIVIECLDAIFKKWGSELSNEEWLQVWVSAHHGAPTKKVRDFIIDHPDVYWSDGATGKETFANRWVYHVWQEGGYTVASLLWIARKAGWLSTTGYEIPDSRVTKINTRYISDWAKEQAELPKRALLISQTGSGKTRNLQYMWERLGKPKTLILVPTVKLASELYHTLVANGMPATLYLDEQTNKAINLDDMRNAKVLVSTLQTFSTKVYTSGVAMASYGLVYIEEIDQLLAGFAKGGGGMYASHVKEKEAKAGYKVLRDAYTYSTYVWGVDATMSQLSLALASSMSIDMVTVLKNTYTHTKARVHLLEDKASAYNVVFRSLAEGKSVVAVCDTVSTAHDVHEVMDNVGLLEDRKAIVITSRTAQTHEVKEFMTDVNAEAKKYDLVCYNSVMGSGVSITEFVPDVVVQICTYLTPRQNLQMLNRYRKQQEVYCYYRTGENLYTRNAQLLIEEFNNRVDVESKIIRIPISARSDNAELRTIMASISIADDKLQNRSPREFYSSLLKGDGRIVDDKDEVINSLLAYSMDEVRELRKERMQYIHANWQTVRPITNENPADPDMTSMEVALGEHHGIIHKALRGNIPDDQPAEYISDVVTQMMSHGFILSEFMVQNTALSRAERYMMDVDKAVSAIQNNVTTIKVVSLLQLLYGTMDTVLTPDIIDTRYVDFVNAVTDNRDIYDAVVSRGREKYESIYDESDLKSTALSFSKTILRRIGLKQKSERYDRKEGEERRQYYIKNLDVATDFLKWRNKNEDGFEIRYTFTTDLIDTQISKRQNASELYRDFDLELQTLTMQYVSLEGMDFEQAVMQVQAEIEGAPSM